MCFMLGVLMSFRHVTHLIHEENLSTVLEVVFAFICNTNQIGACPNALSGSVPLKLLMLGICIMSAVMTELWLQVVKK